jgi:RimJ/RimL family protein N-acetyltransferase
MAGWREKKGIMTTGLFQGKLVRLAVEESQVLAEAPTKWQRDSEFHRLLSTEPAKAMSVKGTKDWIEKILENEDADFLFFTIRTLDEDRLIGFVGLDTIRWTHGDAFVFLALGEREYWGKGYGCHAGDFALRVYRAEPAPGLVGCVRL